MAWALALQQAYRPVGGAAHPPATPSALPGSILRLVLLLSRSHHQIRPNAIYSTHVAKNHVLILTCVIGAARKHFWPNEPLLRGALADKDALCLRRILLRDREAANTFRGVCAITSSKLCFFAE